MVEVETVEKSKEQIEAELTNKKAHLTNLEREFGLAEAQTSDISKRLDILKRERDLITANHKIMLSKFTLLKKTWEFEEDPEYMTNTKKLNELNMEKKLIEYSVQETQLNNLINQVNEQVKALSDSIVKVKEEINELIGE